jgi:hypothetical protein
MGAPETGVVESMMIWVTPASLGVFQQINPHKAGAPSARFRNKPCFLAFMSLPLVFDFKEFFMFQHMPLLPWPKGCDFYSTLYRISYTTLSIPRIGEYLNDPHA